MLKKIVITGLTAMLACGVAQADTKIGVVNPARILAESAPAKVAQANLQKLFKSRDEELAKAIEAFKSRVNQFNKEAVTLTDSERLKKQQELSETERDLARRQRALVEERNQRAQEETQILLSRANRIIQRLAKEQKYDLILQDAVWVNPRVDLTEQVLKELSKPVN